MPSDVVQFLSLDEVLAIQERVISPFGGMSGVRDRGLLESALYHAGGSGQGIWPPRSG